MPRTLMDYRFRLLLIGFSLLIPTIGNVGGETNKKDVTPEEILSYVRYSQAKKPQKFNGEIRPRRIGFKAIPLTVTIDGRMLQFEFFKGNRSKAEVNEVLRIELIENKYKVTSVKDDHVVVVPTNRYHERVRNTDLTYEDLAMRFLTWPDPKLIGEEKAKGGNAWKIRCKNPIENDGYSVVDVWVSQRSGALVRMNGFNGDGVIVKSFEVESVQKYKGEWILEMMNVRSFPTAAGAKPTSSFLKLKLDD